MEESACGQTVAAGVVTEIKGVVREGLNNGGLHFYNNLPGHLIVRVPGTDKYETLKLDPERNYRLETLEGVAVAAKVAKEKFAGDPVVFVGREAVVLVFRENEKSVASQVGTYRHRLSPEWEAVLGLLADEDQQFGKEFDVSDVRKFVRMKMRAAETQSSIAFARAMQTLQSKTQQGVTSNRTSQKESLGKDIEAEVTSAAGQIPEKFDFNVRPFMDPDIPTAGKVGVIVDIEPRDLATTLLASAVDVEELLTSAILKVMEVMKKRLSEVGLPDVPVVAGRLNN